MVLVSLHRIRYGPRVWPEKGNTFREVWSSEQLHETFMERKRCRSYRLLDMGLSEMLNPVAYHCPAHLSVGSSKIKDFVALLRIKEKVEDNI